MGRPESITAAALLHPDVHLTDLGRGRQSSSVFLRSNAPLFYGLGAASLLEAAALASMPRLMETFASEGDLCRYLRDELQPSREARVQTLREYLITHWPEFDWAGAHGRFSEAHASQQGGVRRSAAVEALARCTAVAQSALFYRTVARWTNETHLREISTRFSQEDARAFEAFRVVYERSARALRFSGRRAWRTALTSVQAARDVHVQVAFASLVQEWGPNAPFPPMDYAEFIERMRTAVETYARPGWRERLVFRGWAQVPAAVAGNAASTTQNWFRPVLTIDTVEEPLTPRERWRP